MRERQDGRVGRFWAQLLPWTHPNYNHIYNNFLWEQPEGLQNISCTIKDVKEKPIETGRRGTDAIYSGPTPQWVTHKQKGISQTWKSSLRNEGFKPQIEHLSPRDQNWEYEPP